MYGPPPDCKRFEAGEATVWVNVSGLFAENRSGLDDDPRASVLINLSVTRDALSSAGFPTRRWTVVSSPSPQQTLVELTSKLCRCRGGGKVESVLCFPSAAPFPRPSCCQLQRRMPVLSAAG